MNALDPGAGVHAPPDTRVIGAIVAAVIALAIAIAGAWAVPWFGWVVGIAGLPGTTWLAWHLAPRAVRGGTGDAVRVALELGVLAILVADGLVVAVLLGSAALGAVGASQFAIDPTSLIGGIVQVALSFVSLVVIGACIVGIPAAVVVLPAAFVWAAIVRRVSGARA